MGNATDFVHICDPNGNVCPSILSLTDPSVLSHSEQIRRGFRCEEPIEHKQLLQWKAVRSNSNLESCGMKPV